MGGPVFVSYARSDHVYAEKLIAYLQAAGIQVWWDSALLAGDEWVREIEQRIRTCVAVLVVLTPSAAESQWVRRELHYADNQRKRIIPLSLEACTPPLSIIGLHLEDVSGGALPDSRLITQLGGKLSDEPGDGVGARLHSAARLLPPIRSEAAPLDGEVSGAIVSGAIVSGARKPDASAVLQFLAGLQQCRGGYRAADVVAGMGALLERIGDPDACIGLIPPYFPLVRYFPFVRWRGLGYPPADVNAFVLAHRSAPADFDHALRLLLADDRWLLPDDAAEFPRWARKGQAATLTYSKHPRALLRIPGGWMAVTDSDLRFRIGGSFLPVPFADLDHLRLDVDSRAEGWAYDGAAAGSTTVSRLRLSYLGHDVSTAEANHYTSGIIELKGLVDRLQQLCRDFSTLDGSPEPTT